MGQEGRGLEPRMNAKNAERGERDPLFSSLLTAFLAFPRGSFFSPPATGAAARRRAGIGAADERKERGKRGKRPRLFVFSCRVLGVHPRLILLPSGHWS